MKPLLLLATLFFGCAPLLADINAGVNALGRQNYPLALQEFRPGAERGEPAAQNFLAHTYAEMENYPESYAWYHLSAMCGSLDAEIELAMLSRKMAPEGIEEGKRRGELYYRTYCEK